MSRRFKGTAVQRRAQPFDWAAMGARSALGVSMPCHRRAVLVNFSTCRAHSTAAPGDPRPTGGTRPCSLGRRQRSRGRLGPGQCRSDGAQQDHSDPSPQAAHRATLQHRERVRRRTPHTHHTADAACTPSAPKAPRAVGRWAARAPACTSCSRLRPPSAATAPPRRSTGWNGGGRRSVCGTEAPARPRPRDLCAATPARPSSSRPWLGRSLLNGQSLARQARWTALVEGGSGVW